MRQPRDSPVWTVAPGWSIFAMSTLNFKNLGCFVGAGTRTTSAPYFGDGHGIFRGTTTIHQPTFTI